VISSTARIALGGLATAGLAKVCLLDPLSAPGRDSVFRMHLRSEPAPYFSVATSPMNPIAVSHCLTVSMRLLAYNVTI